MQALAQKKIYLCFEIISTPVYLTMAIFALRCESNLAALGVAHMLFYVMHVIAAGSYAIFMGFHRLKSIETGSIVSMFLFLLFLSQLF